MTAVVAGLTRGWVTLYTAGMAADDRDARRADVESDLWDHQATNTELGVPAFVTAIEMLGRWLIGIPADISWRYERDVTRASERLAMQRRRTMWQTIQDRGLTILAFLMATFFVVVGTFTVLQMRGELTTEERLVYGSMWIIAGLVMLAGVYMGSRSPWMAAGLLALGAIAMALAMFWLFMFLVPAGLIVITLAVLRARRLSAGGPPATA